MFKRGKILGFSKSIYHWEHPDNAVIFNAKIRDEDNQEIWSGDIDLTIDADTIRKKARIGGQVLTVYYEGGDEPIFSTDGERDYVCDTMELRGSIIYSKVSYSRNTDDSEPIPRDWSDADTDVHPLTTFNPNEPMLAFYADVADRLGIGVKDLDISRIGLSVDDYVRLRDMERAHVYRLSEYVHPVKKYQGWTFHWFNYGPECVSDVESGYFYIKS
jgi:hypothetical protein